MPVSIVVPTFNEADNICELVRRIRASVVDPSIEIIFVDDSTDNTPEVILRISDVYPDLVRLLRRHVPVGGLGGAVLEGMKLAIFETVVVMDGDLQHPPELIQVLLRRVEDSNADVVIASRYAEDGDASGLSNVARHAVSRLATILTRAMFPRRLRNCSDPMTGFFLVRKPSIDWEDLHPRGFKILLEILARQKRELVIEEVPFTFGERFAGTSKASLAQGLAFLRQLLSLRFGLASRFATIGAIGALANLAIFIFLNELGVGYVLAAAVSAEVTILANFHLQERFVFRELLRDAGSPSKRFAKSLLFNNLEAVIRIPALWILVQFWSFASIPSAAALLFLAFVARFVFHSRMIYAPPAASCEKQSSSEDAFEAQ